MFVRVLLLNSIILLSTFFSSFVTFNNKSSVFKFKSDSRINKWSTGISATSLPVKGSPGLAPLIGRLARVVVTGVKDKRVCLGENYYLWELSSLNL